MLMALNLKNHNKFGNHDCALKLTQFIDDIVHPVTDSVR
jgi:hypothetical protein